MPRFPTHLFFPLLFLFTSSLAQSTELFVQDPQGTQYWISADAPPRQRIRSKSPSGTELQGPTPLFGKIVSVVNYPFGEGFVGLTDSHNAYLIRWSAKDKRFYNQPILIPTPDQSKEKFRSLKSEADRIEFFTLRGKHGWITRDISQADWWQIQSFPPPLAVTGEKISPPVLSLLQTGALMQLETDTQWKTASWLPAAQRDPTQKPTQESDTFTFENGVEIRLGKGSTVWIKRPGEADWSEDLNRATSALTQAMHSPPMRQYQEATFDQKNNLYLVYSNTRGTSNRSTLDADIIPAALIFPKPGEQPRAEVRSTADIDATGSFDSVVRMEGNPYGEGLIFLTAEKGLFLLQPVQTFNTSERSTASTPGVSFPVVDENVVDFFVVQGRFYYVRAGETKAIGVSPTPQRGIFSIDGTPPLPLPDGWARFVYGYRR